jgi:hypothetical protein
MQGHKREKTDPMSDLEKIRRVFVPERLTTLFVGNRRRTVAHSSIRETAGSTAR